MAQATEIAALVAYSNARASLDQNLGTTLQTNQVEVAEARDSKIMRKSTLPIDVK